MEQRSRPDWLTLALVLLLVTPILVATLATSCDARDERRAAQVTIVEAKARTAAAALASMRVSQPEQAEQLRQRLAIETLEQRAAVQRESFEDYKDLTIYGLTIVGGLVALVGIFFPVGLYLVSIRPAEKVVEEARHLVGRGLDERFEQLLQKRRDDEFARAMEQLRSGDPPEQMSGAVYFSLNPHLPLSSHQILELVEVMRTAEPTLQAQLAFTLAPRDAPAITDLFTALVAADKAALLHGIVRHCVLPSAGALRQKLKDWLLTTAGQPFTSTVLSFASSQAPTFGRELITDKGWIAQLPRMTRVQLLNVVRAMGSVHGRTEFSNGSELAQSVAGTTHTPVDKALKDAPLADAAYIVVHEDGVQKGIYIRGTTAFQEASRLLGA